MSFVPNTYLMAQYVGRIIIYLRRFQNGCHFDHRRNLEHPYIKGYM